MRLKRKQDETNTVPEKVMKPKKTAVVKQRQAERPAGSISTEDFNRYMCEMKVHMTFQILVSISLL